MENIFVRVSRNGDCHECTRNDFSSSEVDLTGLTACPKILMREVRERVGTRSTAYRIRIVDHDHELERYVKDELEDGGFFIADVEVPAGHPHRAPLDGENDWASLYP
ncbi:MAG: hypothetical protein AAGA56_30365 [Myxococcota bacterium]